MNSAMRNVRLIHQDACEQRASLSVQAMRISGEFSVTGLSWFVIDALCIPPAASYFEVLRLIVPHAVLICLHVSGARSMLYHCGSAKLRFELAAAEPAVPDKRRASV